MTSSYCLYIYNSIHFTILFSLMSVLIEICLFHQKLFAPPPHTKWRAHRAARRGLARPTRTSTEGQPRCRGPPTTPAGRPAAAGGARPFLSMHRRYTPIPNFFQPIRTDIQNFNSWKNFRIRMGENHRPQVFGGIGPGSTRRLAGNLPWGRTLLPHMVHTEPRFCSYPGTSFSTFVFFFKISFTFFCTYKPPRK